MKFRPLIPSRLLRWLCAITALANLLGNPLMLALQRPAFEVLQIAPPRDIYLFTLQCALSFTMGMVALVVCIRPDRGTLLIGIIGKGLYAGITYYFWAIGQVAGVFLIFVAWDALFVIVFFLYWIQLAQPELFELGHSLYAGLDTRHGQKRRALVVGLSLTGNGRRAIDRLQLGLEAGGYVVDLAWVRPQETIFSFPMSLGAFARNVVRAMFRVPARGRLEIGDRHDWDLVVVESPTWMLGAAAPVETVLASDQHREIFLGRDAAVLVVCRGAWQRSCAMLVARLERAGANVVAARGFPHQGWEPARLMLLWWKLIAKKDRLWGVTYGLSDQSLDHIQQLGVDLAHRVRNRPHWTLLPEARHV